MNKLALALLLFLITISGCTCGDPGPAPPDLFNKWQKEDDPSVTLQITEGGLLFFTDGANDYNTTYEYYDDHELQVCIKNFGIKGWSGGLHQHFGGEVLPSGVLLFITAEQGDYQDNELIRTMCGRYIPCEAEETPIVTPPTASERIRTRLDALRLEAAKVNINLKRLQEDREIQLIRLERTGVSSPADLKDNPEAQALADELAEIIQQINQAASNEEKYMKIIADLASAQRRFRRRETAEQTELAPEDVDAIDNMLAEATEKLGEISKNTIEQSLTTETVLEEQLNERAKEKKKSPEPEKIKEPTVPKEPEKTPDQAPPPAAQNPEPPLAPKEKI